MGHRYAREHPENLMLFTSTVRPARPTITPRCKNVIFPVIGSMSLEPCLTADARCYELCAPCQHTAPFKVKAYHDHRTGEWHPQDVLLLHQSIRRETACGTIRNTFASARSTPVTIRSRA